MCVWGGEGGTQSEGLAVSAQFLVLSFFFLPFVLIKKITYMNCSGTVIIIQAMYINSLKSQGLVGWLVMCIGKDRPRMRSCIQNQW